MTILLPVLIVVLIGFVCAGILTLASKVFFVPVDETFTLLREQLPGANCGGCGYAGCDDYANALVEDNSIPCNKCTAGGPDVVAALAEILGVTAEAAEKEVAVVMCNGTREAAKPLMEYTGLKTCAAAKRFFGGVNRCPYGCMGLGDCVAACEFDAISICDGVAVVNRDNCVACGACARACPNKLIRISPAKNLVVVQCHSTAKAADTRKSCSNGCVGCRKCSKVCKFNAIRIKDSLAFIEPEKCRNCGLCAKECPTGAILNMRVKKPAPKKAEASESAAAAE